MDFEFIYDGDIHNIKIDIDSDGIFNALIGDKKFSFQASALSPNTFSILNASNSIVGYAAENETSVFVFINGNVIKLDKVLDDQNNYSGGGVQFGAKDEVSTPMPGKIVKILVEVGEKVAAKQSLVIVESMKMENEIKAPTNAEIKSIHFEAGDLVEPGSPIIKLIPEE